MMREAITEAMSSKVAVKAVWLWEGLRKESARRQRGVEEVVDIGLE
jgi:hypothetical protein